MVKKLLIGCGVAALLCVLLLIGGTWMIANWARSKFPDTKRIETMQDDLKQRFGERDAFVPAATLDPARLEVFLGIRDSLVALGGEVSADITDLTRIGKEAEAKNRGLIERIITGTNAARGGLGVATRALDYTLRRGQALLAADMGEGEYGWWFALSYFSYLEWNPTTADTVRGGEHVRTDTNPRETWSIMRDTFIAQLRNLETALAAQASRSAAETELLEVVRREIAETAGGGRFPLAGRLPGAWRAVLEPRHARIVATRPTGAAELFLDRMQYRNQGFNFQIDRGESDSKPPAKPQG
jgi:hypothetical protein